jgi:hypothetical protein
MEWGLGFGTSHGDLGFWWFLTLNAAGGARRTPLDPGVRRDDGGNFTVVSTTMVITCM